MGVWAGVPFLADIEHYQDYAWIELSFTVTNNNAYANVSTYQDLVLQLLRFSTRLDDKRYAVDHELDCTGSFV
ncbi:hypothetical protein LEP1GSC107_1168 [Leptospira interrogans serovar Grippotyphosa str. UI 12769]|nr:hypothetical protein LEP1GSC107_1168 [Leptospira interrogans serovar Grippotyphosa str. UI 12769]